MLNLDLLLKSAPQMPSITGKWASVYLEPMLGSGERFTIIVAAISTSGEVLVRPAIRKEVIEVMYGFKSTAVQTMIDVVCDSLKSHLDKNKNFDGWIPPVTGVTIGNQRIAASASSTGILRQAISLSSSLSSLTLDEETLPAQKRKKERDRWATQLMQTVLHIDPKREIYFNKGFTFSDGHRPAKIFYLSDYAAINTGKLLPANLNQLVIENKAKISDLSMVKKHYDFFPRVNHELLVFRPPDDDPRYSDKNIASIHSAYLALKDLAETYGVNISPVYSVEQASKKILDTAA